MHKNRDRSFYSDCEYCIVLLTLAVAYHSTLGTCTVLHVTLVKVNREWTKIFMHSTRTSLMLIFPCARIFYSIKVTLPLFAADVLVRLENVFLFMPPYFLRFQ